MKSGGWDFPFFIYRSWYRSEKNALREVSKYGVISGPYFPVVGLNTGKYGQEITPLLDTSHAVIFSIEKLNLTWIS